MDKKCGRVDDAESCEVQLEKLMKSEFSTERKNLLQIEHWMIEVECLLDTDSLTAAQSNLDAVKSKLKEITSLDYLSTIIG